MQTQLKITLQDLEHSAALDARIRAKVAKLEQAFPRLIGCHVVVSETASPSAEPAVVCDNAKYCFSRREVVVTRDDRDDVYALVRDAFATAERELEKSLGRPRRTRRTPSWIGAGNGARK